MGYVDAQGNLNIAEFARFLGKKYSTVHKYVKNERNIGGGFKLELKHKIPTLNLEYFEDQEKPLYISDNVANSQPDPLSGENLAALEEYRNKCADLQKENDRLKAKINKLENLNFALIEYVHNYLQTTNNLKHPANERTKKQPTLVKSG